MLPIILSSILALKIPPQNKLQPRKWRYILQKLLKNTINHPISTTIEPWGGRTVGSGKVATIVE